MPSHVFVMILQNMMANMVEQPSTTLPKNRNKIRVSIPTPHRHNHHHHHPPSPSIIKVLHALDSIRFYIRLFGYHLFIALVKEIHREISGLHRNFALNETKRCIETNEFRKNDFPRIFFQFLTGKKSNFLH